MLIEGCAVQNSHVFISENIFLNHKDLLYLNDFLD